MPGNPGLGWPSAPCQPELVAARSVAVRALKGELPYLHVGHVALEYAQGKA